MTLQDWLYKQRITRAAFANAIGITRQGLWLIIEKRSIPSLETAFKIESATKQAIKAASWLPIV
jgi:DNA-binding XRE family transcriptional regulator